MEPATNASESGWRGSPEVWLQAAYEALLESGIDSVRILPLAKKIGLSRTSFYWFFKDREALLEGLLARWRNKNTGSIVKQSEAYAESIVEAMLNVFDCWHGKDVFDAQLEFAVRSWALQSDKVLSEVRDADTTRVEAIARMFLRFGYEPGIADVRARTTYLTQIGYISMQLGEKHEVRMKRVPRYIEIFTGCKPEKRELERYYARHAYLSTVVHFANAAGEVG